MKEIQKANKIEDFIKKFSFKTDSILIFTEAFTHRSFLNENTGEIDRNNERLEFLGDAVLELIISLLLYSRFPDKKEGELTSFRSAIVKKETLAEVSKSIGLGNYIKMSKGEEITGGREKEYLLANTFEAVLGAIYITEGFEKSKSYIEKVLGKKIDEIVKNRLDINNKSLFQELSQAKFKITPVYKVLSESGPDHEKLFKIGVYLGKNKFGEGEGNSKQIAEDNAAKEGILKIKNDK